MYCSFRLFVFQILFVAVICSEAMAKYNPELGRFIQRDPIGYIDGQNLVQYARSNPVRFVDTYGLFMVTFDSTIPESDRSTILAAIDEACNAVSDANEILDGVSQCAAERLGDSFGDTRDKLKLLEQACHSNQPLPISGDSQGNGVLAALRRRPGGGYTLSVSYDLDGDPELNKIWNELFGDPLNKGPDLPPGAPGNTWLDDSKSADPLPPAQILLHELTHLTEFMTGDDNRDGERGTRHDSPYNIETLVDGFENSTLGKAVAEAEKCCGGE